jgi:hypothetical protein
MRLLRQQWQDTPRTSASATAPTIPLQRRSVHTFGKTTRLSDSGGRTLALASSTSTGRQASQGPNMALDCGARTGPSGRSLVRRSNRNHLVRTNTHRPGLYVAIALHRLHLRHSRPRHDRVHHQPLGAGMCCHGYEPRHSAAQVEAASPIAQNHRCSGPPISG